MKQPSSVDYYLYHPVIMQERTEQRATFSLNADLLVYFGLSPDTERLKRPLHPTALLRSVSNLQTEHSLDMVKSSDLLDETEI